MGNQQSPESAPFTYSPTATIPSFKVFMQVITHEDMHLEHYDVNQAFLLGDIDVQICVEQPEGFKEKGKEDWVVFLDKALYGLLQAAFFWYQSLSKWLISQNFIVSDADACEFTKTTPYERKRIFHGRKSITKFIKLHWHC